MAKVRFNANAMKGFFTHNVEKMLFACVVLVFLVFVYGAIGREKLELAPEDLTKAVDEAKQRLANTDPSGVDEELPIKDYPAMAMGIRRAVDDKFYQHPTLWDRALFERGDALRRQPEIYPVRDVRGTPGYGSVGAGASGMDMGMASGMEMMPGMPGMPMGTRGQQQALGRRWVLLTGLVEMAKQIEAFKEALPSTSIPGRTQAMGMGEPGMMADPGMSGMPGGPTSLDDPNWAYVRVERAEVSSTGAGQLTWQLLNTREQRQKIGNVAQYGGDAMMDGSMGAMGSGSDIVESRYVVSPWVTFPLPNLYNYKWGAEAAHAPEIPLRPKQTSLLGPDGMPAGMTPDSAIKRPEIPDDPLAPGAMMPGMGMSGMEGMMPGMDPMTMSGMEGMGMPGMPVKKAEIGLFRFFDFTVAPGKHYRYRVRLVLANPNFGLSARYLETEELAKERWIETDWSEPTDTISVPRDSRLLVGEVKSSRYVTVEPSTTMILVHFDEMTGKESSAEKADVLRGQLVNYDVEVEKAAATGMMPGMEGMMDPMMMDPMAAEAGGAPARRPPRRRQPEKEEEKEYVQYRTGNVLLDMSGGDRLPGRDRDLTEPSKLLLLDADGNLVVRTELEDKKEFKKYKKEEKPKAKTPAMSPEEMMGMPPDMMSPDMMQPRRRGR